MNQTSFIERAPRTRFKRSKPAELSEKYRILADWYSANKPQVKTLRITPADARSIRENWAANEIECRQNGFSIAGERMSYRGFDLVEQS